MMFPFSPVERPKTKTKLRVAGALAFTLGISTLVSCASSAPGARQRAPSQSDLATLKIAGIAGDWANLEVKFASESNKSPEQKFTYKRAAFGADGLSDASVTVVQDKYFIDLVYTNAQSKITFKSCPKDKKVVHDLIGKPQYVAKISVCPENSTNPVGEVNVSEGSNVSIDPVIKNPYPTTPSSNNSALPKDAKFWIDPYSQAMSEAKNLRAKQDPNASLIEYIAQQPAGVWYGPWSGDIKQAVSQQVKGAQSTGTWAVMIPYNIPYRDCGQHSAGGLKADEYRRWIGDLASAIGDAKTIIVLEPDSLTLQRCLNNEQLAERMSLLREAVQKLKANKNTLVYLDAGHSNFASVDEISPKLLEAGLDKADGFALNVSNYQTTESNIAFGLKVSDKVGRKPFLIDTSRNGNGPRGDQWCNPRGRALGKATTANTGVDRVQAYLWLKRPGESDGQCENGNDSSGQGRSDLPAAGVWWQDLAVELAKNAGIK